MPREFRFCGNKTGNPERQDRPVLPARIANQNTGASHIIKISTGILLGRPIKMMGSTSYGLASHPGGVQCSYVILPV